MKIYLIPIFLLFSLFSSYSTLNAVGNEDENIETSVYNPADYDPGIPREWIRSDGTFGE